MSTVRRPLIMAQCMANNGSIHYSEYCWYMVSRQCGQNYRYRIICLSFRKLVYYMYDLETCPLKKSDFRSLDFIIDRFFMKLFRTTNMDTVRLCQESFNAELPTDTVKRQTLT